MKLRDRLKIFLRTRFFMMLSVTIIFTILSCSNSTEPCENIEPFDGQLETDLDNGIIKPDGTLWMWGGNSTGQLGDGTMNPSLMPKQVPIIKNVVSIDLVEGAAYAADKEGNIWFWGDRLIWSEPPDKDTIVLLPKRISILKGIKYIQASGSNVDLLRDDGSVWQFKWDHNTPTKFINPVRIGELDNISAISGFLALKKDGTLCEFPEYNWREPIDGGINSSINLLQDVKQHFNIRASHSIVLQKNGMVKAWGRNFGGFLGDGTFVDNPTPKMINTLSEIIQISADGGRCLALKKDGSVWFWGLVESSPVLQSQSIPSKIENIENVKLIHANATNKCIVMKNDYSYWTIDIKTKVIKKIEL